MSFVEDQHYLYVYKCVIRVELQYWRLDGKIAQNISLVKKDVRLNRRKKIL